MIEMNWSLMPRDMFSDWMKIIEALKQDNNSDKDYRYQNGGIGVYDYDYWFRFVFLFSFVNIVFISWKSFYIALTFWYCYKFLNHITIIYIYQWEKYIILVHWNSYIGYMNEKLDS